MGQASFEELVDIYADQAAGLEQAGVDLYVIETMMTLSMPGQRCWLCVMSAKSPSWSLLPAMKMAAASPERTLQRR